MWSLIGILVAFAVVIFSVRARKSFGFAMLLAAGILAIFSQGQLTLQETVIVFREALTSLDTLTLTAGVALIGILANAMKETDEIEAVIENLRGKIPEGGTLASIPAVFGLLPIPGGALLSAPLVDEEGKRMEVSESGRVFLNLWFRHIGFLIFPLAPPLLLLAHEANVPLHWLILIQMPIFLLALWVGVFVIWREMRENSRMGRRNMDASKSQYSLLCFLSTRLW